MWVWTLLLRAVVAYLLLRLTARLLDLASIRESGAFNLAILFALTVLTGFAVLGAAPDLVNIGLLAVTWVGLFLLERYVFVRSRVFRQNTGQEPIVLVYRGKLLEHNLYRKRLTVQQLLSKMRARSAFHLADVELAILEPDGDLSIMRKPQAEPLTRQDMLVAGKDCGLELEVISDGEIIYENLERRHLSEKWLRDHLRAFDVEFVSEVALATVNEHNELYVDKYDDRLSQRHELHPYQRRTTSEPNDSPRTQVLREQPLSRPEQTYAERQMQQAIKDSLPNVPKKQ